MADSRSPNSPAACLQMEDTVRLQCVMLSSFGLLRDPSSNSSQGGHIFWSVLRVLCMMWLVGCWFSFGVNAAIAVASLTVTDDKESSTSAIIQAFVNIPFAAYNLRGVLILTILFFKGDNLLIVLQLTNRVMFSSFPDKVPRTLLFKWKLFSVGGALVTLILEIIWETLNTLQYMYASNADLNSDGILYPVPMHMRVWQYSVFWTICAALPFYLSQEVMIVFLVIGQVLTDCCSILHKNIDGERQKMCAFFDGKNHEIKDRSFRRHGDAGIFCEEIVDRIVQLKGHYMHMSRVCNFVNHHVGSIFGIQYGLDLLTMFGSVAAIVAGDDEGVPLVRAYYFVSSCIFLMFCTAFLWPLVSAYEKVKPRIF